MAKGRRASGRLPSGSGARKHPPSAPRRGCATSASPPTPRSRPSPGPGPPAPSSRPRWLRPGATPTRWHCRTSRHRPSCAAARRVATPRRSRASWPTSAPRGRGRVLASRHQDQGVPRPGRQPDAPRPGRGVVLLVSRVRRPDGPAPRRPPIAPFLLRPDGRWLVRRLELPVGQRRAASLPPRRRPAPAGGRPGHRLRGHPSAVGGRSRLAVPGPVSANRPRPLPAGHRWSRPAARGPVTGGQPRRLRISRRCRRAVRRLSARAAPRPPSGRGAGSG